nr:hypothetical protein [Dietzia sp. CW19]
MVAGDLEAVLDLYAENATVEDPVGNGTVHEGKATINVWDLMTHDEQGKIRSMRAYWTPENMR